MTFAMVVGLSLVITYVAHRLLGGYQTNVVEEKIVGMDRLVRWGIYHGNNEGRPVTVSIVRPEKPGTTIMQAGMHPRAHYTWSAPTPFYELVIPPDGGIDLITDASSFQEVVFYVNGVRLRAAVRDVGDVEQSIRAHGDHIEDNEDTLP